MTTVTYEQMPAGEMKVHDGRFVLYVQDRWQGISHAVGDRDILEIHRCNTWETTGKSNGKVNGHLYLKRRPTAKSLTARWQGHKVRAKRPTTRWSSRIGGAPGFKRVNGNQNVKISSPGVVDLAPKGADGLVLTSSDEKGVCDAKSTARIIRRPAYMALRDGPA